jgi:hypothetical protein
MKHTVILLSLAPVAALASLVLALSSCSSHNGPRDLMLEEARGGAAVERPVAMRGEGTFLEGKLAALATVSRGFDRGGGATSGGSGGSGRGARGGRGGKRGGSGDDEDGVYGEGRRRRDDVGAFTEVYNIGGYGDSEEEQKEAMQDYLRQARARRAAGSPMPPVTLKVAFENKGTEPIEVEVTEVNSDLGNFAVRPSKLTIPPGQSAMLQPMVSQLGVTSDEIPLKLEVRTGGKKEQQVVVVKNIIATSLRKEFEALQK